VFLDSLSYKLICGDILKCKDNRENLEEAVIFDNITCKSN
jgi:hypothetical protein